MANGNSQKGGLRGNYLLPVIAAVLAVVAICAAVWLIFSQSGPGLFGRHGSSSSPSSSAPVSSSSKPVSSSSAISTSELSSTSLDNANYFNSAVLIGDSITKGVDLYKIDPDATVLAGNGLSVANALRYKVSVNGQNVLLLDAVTAKKPAKIFIMLGVNDVSYVKEGGDLDVSYTALVSALHAKLPQAKVYVQSILPVTAKYEAKHTAFTNAKIDAVNAALKADCAAMNAQYVDVAQLFKGADGKLVSSMSTDGLNIKPRYYYVWLNYLSRLG